MLTQLQCSYWPVYSEQLWQASSGLFVPTLLHAAKALFVNTNYLNRQNNFEGKRLAIFFCLFGWYYPSAALRGLHCVFSVKILKVSEKYISSRQDGLQCCKILFCKAVFFVSPFMKIHTVVVAAGNATKESHTILGCAITGSHHISTASWGVSSINGSDGPSRIFTPLICNI